MATGTTSGTGALIAVGPNYKFAIKMDFGSGSVDIEEKMPSGAWIKVVTGITADYSNVWESPAMTTIRLNVTAHVSAIEWAVIPGDLKS
jgi:anaerobic glycerol-3-phosphate dehydrogenase